MTAKVLVSMGMLPLLAALALPGCGDDDGCVQYICQDDGLIGVPLQPVCDDDHCTNGASCTSVIELAAGGDLSVAASAGSGTCISLAPGSYGDATVAAGVSILGRSADQVFVGRLTIAKGSGSLLRGIQAKHIDVQGTTGLRLEAVRVAGDGDANGIDVQKDSSVTMFRSEVTKTDVHAVYVDSAVSITIQRSFIHRSAGPGLWVTCETGCDCPRLPIVTLENVHLEKNHHVGVAVVGASLTMNSVTILDTKQLEDLTIGGGGLAVSGCSEVEVQGLEVNQSAGPGVFISNSSGNIGNAAEQKGIIIVEGYVGVWLQDIDNGFTLQGFELQNNRGVGLGIGGGSKGIIIVEGNIGGTQNQVMPVANGGKKDVGDAMVWTDGATVDVSALSVSGSARNAILIDGPVGAGSKIADISLGGGDEGKGVVHQNFTEGQLGPETGANTPQFTVDPNQLFDVPKAPESAGAVSKK